MATPNFLYDDAYITLASAQALWAGADPHFAGTPPLYGVTSPFHCLVVALLLPVLSPLWALMASSLAGAVAYAAGLWILGRGEQLGHLESAARWQASRLPSVTPLLDDFEIAGWTLQADDIGGDFYDWSVLATRQGAGPRPRAAARSSRGEIPLRAPISDEQIRSLKVGDVVLVSGRMFTGRDAVHAHLMKHEPPVDLRGSVLYHCGPVVVKDETLVSPKPHSGGGGWRVTAAGPTTSIREEPYQAEILKRYGVRAVIGKGGMGAKTLAGLKESGAVYLNAIGGAAQFYARCIERVEDVSLMEFGTPEAMWHLEVRDFPAIVTMDAHGNSLHKDVEDESGAILETLR